MVRDLQMTPSSIEMRVRIKGTRAALAGWEPDILGLSIRWPFLPDDEQPRLAEQQMGPQGQRQSDPLVGTVCRQRF